jgi:bifunctional DNA-binding transcriptional regulator/antitoxin component of YhaV-PrlF toxin-antitoxin module
MLKGKEVKLLGFTRLRSGRGITVVERAARKLGIAGGDTLLYRPASGRMIVEKETPLSRERQGAVAKSPIGPKHHTTLPKPVAQEMGLGKGFVCFIESGGKIAIARPDLSKVRGSVYELTGKIRGDLKSRYTVGIQLTHLFPRTDRKHLEGLAGKHQLIADPLPFLQNLRNYYGLATRRQVTGQIKEDDEKLTGRIVDGIVSSQNENGSWENLIVATSWRLIQLSNLGLDATAKPVGKGVEWLLSQIDKSKQYIPLLAISPNDSRKEGKRYYELNPLTRVFKTQQGGYCFRSNYYPTGIALKALARLGFGNEPKVKRVYDTIIKGQNKTMGGWCACDPDSAGVRCTSALLEALGEHPELRNSKAARLSLEYFRNVQNEDGTWGKGLFSCFYHILDLVSRFKQPAALEQTVKAIPYLVNKQHRDGTWGGQGKDLFTYTAVSALHRQGLLNLLGRRTYGTQR